MGLFKKGSSGNSGAEGTDTDLNAEIEAEVEASAAADAQIAAAEVNAAPQEAVGVTEAQTNAPASAAPISAPAGANAPAEENISAQLSSGHSPVGAQGASGADDGLTAGGDLDSDIDDDLDDFDEDFTSQGGGSKKKLLMAGVALAVLAVGAFGLMSMMGGGGSAPTPQSEVSSPGQQQAGLGAPQGMPGGDENLAAAGGLPMPEPASNLHDGSSALPPSPALPSLGEGTQGVDDTVSVSSGALPGLPDVADTQDMDDHNALAMDHSASGDDMLAPPPFPFSAGEGEDNGVEDAAKPLAQDDAAVPDLPMPVPPMADSMVTTPPEMPTMPEPVEAKPIASGQVDSEGVDVSGASGPLASGTEMTSEIAEAVVDDGEDMIDELDKAMSAAASAPMEASEKASSLTESLGGALAPVEVGAEDATPPDLSALDDVDALAELAGDKLAEDPLMDLEKQLGNASSGAAGPEVGAGLPAGERATGRLNIDDLEAEKPLTPIFPRSNKYLEVKKDYSSSSVRAKVEAAQRALKNGQDSLALELFDALYVKHPRDPRIMMGRAVALQKNGMIDEAIDAYEKVLKRDPRNVNAMTNMLGLLRLSNPDEALAKLLDLKATYPGRPSILAQLGMTYADIGDEESALRYLKMAQELQPDDPRHAFNIAVLMDRRGQSSEAIMQYKRALFLNSSSPQNLVPTAAIQQRLDALR